MFKAGYVGVLGRPNAGKSSLINHLIGEKVSIVTAKPQTTRQRIQGIFTDDLGQIIFVDAPGFVRGDKGLNKFLHTEYTEVMEESDALLAVISLDEKDPKHIEKLLDSMKASGKPWCAVVTKTDLSFMHRTPLIRDMVTERGGQLFTYSVVKPEEQQEEFLVKGIQQLLPESPAPLYDPEIYTTQSLRELTSEVIREKCFEHFQQEVPYGLVVQIRKYQALPDIDRIYADIIVSRDGHRPMVVGHGGKTLKSVGTMARKDIERSSGKKVFLDLHVKVKKNWMSSKPMMKEFGYVSTREANS